jgi:hypothetical protein
MDNESKDTLEPSSLQTSEIRLIHWETQKGISQGDKGMVVLLIRTKPRDSVESVILKELNKGNEERNNPSVHSQLKSNN